MIVDPVTIVRPMPRFPMLWKSCRNTKFQVWPITLKDGKLGWHSDQSAICASKRAFDIPHQAR